MLKRIIVLSLAATLSASVVLGPFGPIAHARPTCKGKVATIVGSRYSDQIGGTNGPDVMVGLGGNDVLVGFAGNDTICGGAGNDDLVGLGGRDVLDGGGGYFDRYNTDRSFQNRMLGGPANDLLIGGPGFDVLAGHGGNDRMLGRGGGDAMVGHGGDDLLDGGGGSFDFYLPMGGNDKVVGGPGTDRVSYYGSGAVRASLATGIATGAGRDRISGTEQLEGSNKNDHLTGNRRQNFLFGLRGDDVLRGGKGDDLLTGQEGSDLLDGDEGEDVASFYFARKGATADLRTRRGSDGAGVDRFVSIMGLEGSGANGVKNTLYGDGKRNYLVGTTKARGGSISGLGGRDEILNWTRGAKVNGGDDRDRITTSAAAKVDGGSGNDKVVSPLSVQAAVTGGAGEDTIRAWKASGGEGKDTLVGMRLSGNAGNDLLVGDPYPSYADVVLLPGPGDDEVFAGPSRNFVGHTRVEDATQGTATPPVGQGEDVLSYVRVPDSIHARLRSRSVWHASQTDSLVAGLATIVGTRKADRVEGDALDNALLGWRGNDELSGVDGNDLLDGGAGEDTGDGGLGLDECPKIETKTACEDVDIPDPPVVRTAGDVSKLLARVGRLRPQTAPSVQSAGGAGLADGPKARGSAAPGLLGLTKLSSI